MTKEILKNPNQHHQKQPQKKPFSYCFGQSNYCQTRPNMHYLLHVFPASAFGDKLFQPNQKNSNQIQTQTPDAEGYKVEEITGRLKNTMK